MAGFSSMDDFVSEITTQGKFWRQDWVKQTTAGTHAASRWYDMWVNGGTPPAALYSGTTKTAVACTSTPLRLTTGTATSGNATITGVTDTTGVKVGQLITGTCNGVAQTAGTYVASFVANTSITMSANATGSGAIDLTLAFPTIWHGGDVSTDTKHLVNIGATFVGTGPPMTIQLVDVLAYYPIASADLISTSQRVLTNTEISSALPRYTDGKGVRAYFVCTTAPTAGGPNLTEFTYINQDGNTRNCPLTPSMNATPIQSHIIHSDAGANKFQFIPLANGDSGIRRVTSFTFSGGTAYTGSGAAALVLCRPITTIPIPVSGYFGERNLLMQMPSLPRIYDGACLNILKFTSAVTTASTNIYGYSEFAWG